MASPLVEVRRATVARQRAELRYRRSLERALESGFSYADVARVAGVSRQAVRQLLRKA